jgi:hypothetical protein
MLGIRERPSLDDARLRPCLERKCATTHASKPQIPSTKRLVAIPRAITRNGFPSRDSIIGLFLSRTSTVIPVEREVDVLQGQFRCVACAALSAVLRVSPRPDEACLGGVEEDSEAVAVKVQLDPPVGSPLRGHRSVSNFDAFQDAAESQMLRVEDPGAVT